MAREPWLRGRVYRGCSCPPDWREGSWSGHLMVVSSAKGPVLLEEQAGSCLGRCRAKSVWRRRLPGRWEGGSASQPDV